MWVFFLCGLYPCMALQITTLLLQGWGFDLFYHMFYQDASSGRTPLHYAIELENFQLTNFFLENGCLVNAATYAGWF